VSVFCDELWHPCQGIAVKDNVFGTPHNQAVDVDSLAMADTRPTEAKIRE